MFSFALAEREECSMVMLMSTAKQCKHIIEACDIYAKHIAVYKVYNKAPILACHLKSPFFFFFFFFCLLHCSEMCAEKLQF